MRTYSFVFVLAFVFVSCQDLNTPEKPKKLLSTSEMEAVLTDLVILDAMISVNNFRIDNLEMNLPDFIYKKHNIDSTTLAKNIKYYNSLYDENVEIYENVKTNVEKLKHKVEENKRKKDSIERIEKERKREKDSLLERQR